MKKHSDFQIQKMKKTSLLVTIILGLFLLFPGNVFSYDFSDARRSLKNDLESMGKSASQTTIAIVYNIPDRTNVKKKYDLVKLKQDLSYELLKSFSVTDPIITQEIINTNHLSYEQIRQDDEILRQFANRAGSSQILLVDLHLNEVRLLANMQLVNSDNIKLSQVKMELVPEAKVQPTYKTAKPVSTAKVQPTYKTAKPVSTSSKSKKTAFQSFSMGFNPKSFVEGQNDTWMYFAPTALINPEYQSVEMLLWLKNLAEVDVQIARFRYSVRILGMLQFGVQSYAIMVKDNAESIIPNTKKEMGHHSTYISLKYKIVDDSSAPAELAFGARRRIIWDDDNTDFTASDDETNDKNDDYNQVTLQLMVTGKVEQLGLLYNAYLDSMTFGSGIKFLLTPNIKLFADSMVYYYEKPQISNDFATGIYLYNPTGSVSLNYQVSTKQVQMGLAFDF